MSASSSGFAEFTREWGGLLAQDSTASLDHLFSVYKNIAKTSDVTQNSSSDSGNGKSPCNSFLATIEDFTEIWASSKRVNGEWEAACMVRGIRSSIDGLVTQKQLMLSMLCCAATFQNRQQKFFKECFMQVRRVIHEAALRCIASADDESTESVYEEVAFCVALELLGWHNRLMVCLERVMTLLRPLRTEDDVLLFTQKVAQDLGSGGTPRRNSTDSSPAITTTRTSELSTSFEQELPVRTSAVVKKKKDVTASLAVTSATGDEAVVTTSLRGTLSKGDAPSELRGRAERTHALRRSFSTMTTASLDLSFRKIVSSRRSQQKTRVASTHGVRRAQTPQKSKTVIASHRASVCSASSASLPLPPPSVSTHSSSIIRIPPPQSLVGKPHVLTALPSCSSLVTIVVGSQYKRIESAVPDVCRPPAHKQAPRHRVRRTQDGDALGQAMGFPG